MQSIDDRINEFLDKELIGDCLQILNRIPSDSIDLMYSDLPYNERSIDYGNDSRDWNSLSRPQYFEKMRELGKAAYRIIRGHCAIQIGPFDDKEKLLIVFHSFTDAGFIPSESSLIMQRKDGYKSILGIFSKEQATVKLNKPFWDLTHVQYRNTIRGIHPATTCPEIAKVLIETFTKEGDVVLDPFNGTSTTTYMARKLNRKFIGIELYDWQERFFQNDPIAKFLGKEKASNYYRECR
jgi:DNA modification methylase